MSPRRTLLAAAYLLAASGVILTICGGTLYLSFAGAVLALTMVLFLQSVIGAGSGR
jgi:hypothetical protein